MKKNAILRLILFLGIIFIFDECRSDDFLHTSGNIDYSQSVKVGYNKLSPWDEDENFIKMAQHIFFKNVDYNYFLNKYGEVNWDYAMSFGNFDSSYLVVPIIKNNSTVHVMKIIRKNSKIFFYEKQDVAFIEFFNNVMLNKNLSVKEKIAYNDSENSKALIFKCVYRTITVGCPSGYFDCEPISNMVSECNWQEENGSGNPTQMEFCNPLECNGGGGGGFDLPDILFTNLDIINNLQGYPCAQSIVQQLPTLTNDLASSMKQIFQNNNNYNITFKPKTGLGLTDGETFSSYSTEFGTFNAVININADILQNATKEYILVTLYHEVIHAFLKYELFKLGETAFKDQYPSVIVGYDYAANGIMINRFTFLPEHQELGAFLSTLQNILMTYNPDLSFETARAMAKAGITTMTQAEHQLNNNERNTALGNYQGTKCP
ncbi:hypothetical protein SAMN05421846_106238 [Chryseobacterium taeanense]|uniref:Uncharacterized protein n=1 Tax=Chryseobacterium taeanense TaxID=311334 RepID=A0A1G8JW04_9FLAO|nr:hypothetical protein [Chryseobacterium taeanense]SDI35432.1 hypothetical protein SAMN05421846_106238 [Chryseobacterium taeanense]